MSVLKIKNASTGTFESVPAIESSVIVADGSVTEDKLAPDVLDMIETAASSAVMKMSNIQNAGQLFTKPDELPYCGWPFNNIQYDASTNQIVFLINAAKQHGDNGNTHLWMGKMNLDSYEVTIKEIGNPETLEHGFYCMGFCIDSSGNYWYIDAQSKMLGKSTDKGATWTETSVSTYNGWPESITQLSNGRFLFWGDKAGDKSIWYSDDDCATWTKASLSNGYYEGSFLELPDDDGTYTGKVMCFMRQSTNGTTNGQWNGTKRKEAICISYSSDFGSTWTAGKASTTLLEGCANIATAFYHADEDFVEVFTSPRYPYNGTKGAIFQYITTRKDALDDKFGTPRIVTYSRAKDYQDFGHIGGCFDGNGDMHLMYYDGDSASPDTCNYYYMKASRGQASLPSHLDEAASTFLPYSGIQVVKAIETAKKELSRKINAIIIAGGGTIDDEDYYVTDDLTLDLDFTNLSKIDATTGKITDTYGTQLSGTFDPDTKQMTGDVTVPASTIQTLTPDNTEYSIEICMDLLSNYGQYDEPRLVWYKNEYTDLIDRTKYEIRFTDTNSTSSSYTKAVSGHLYRYAGRYHLVFTFDTSGVAKVYKNNSVVSTYTVADFDHWGSRSEKWIINYLSKVKYVFFRIYKRALTADEIAQNYRYFIS